ncbi:MAG: hypothetical protein IJT43_00630 [Stomatobaculum sp.]|nr:hypothetical protein [Stomatobaculum sp.]
MTEYRAKKMTQIEKKIDGLINELDLLIDAESMHSLEELIVNLSDAMKMLQAATYKLQEAEACAQLQDMGSKMQEQLNGFRDGEL